MASNVSCAGDGSGCVCVRPCVRAYVFVSMSEIVCPRICNSLAVDRMIEVHVL